MGNVLKLFFLFLFTLTGCVAPEYGLSRVHDDITEPSIYPNIQVYPHSMNFGEVNAGDDAVDEILSIWNGGLDTLVLDGLEFKNPPSVFSFTVPETDTLEHEDQIDIIVTYDPESYDYYTNSIFITSNDPDEPIIEIPLFGEGAAPIIDINPEIYDYGPTLIGCDKTLVVDITNIGNQDLEITEINYYVTLPANFDIELNESLYGYLPWTLAPGETKTVEIYYWPSEKETDFGYIEVVSNDPERPAAYADQEGEGAHTAPMADTFDQKEISSADILFVVDNSCSMGDKQTQLKNNFDQFMNVFAASGVDYNIGLITTDSYDLVGPIITPATVDPVAELVAQVDSIGIGGNANEIGIYQSYYALQPGYPAGPGGAFWRTDSRLVIIYISDEDDNSAASGVTHSMVETYVLGAKGSLDYVVAHAVAGDYPGGCTTNGGGIEAYEYYTLVTALNGSFLSICQDDWGTPMQNLATNSILAKSFVLSLLPIEDSISVIVNGVIVTDWYYELSNNSVYFFETSIPPAGSEIVITYSPLPECGNDTGDTGP